MKKHKAGDYIKKEEILHKPRILEVLGTKYYRYLFKRRSKEIELKLPTDAILKKKIRYIRLRAAIGAFLAGAITTIPTVYFDDFLENETFAVHYSILGAIILVCFIIEFIFLFFISIKEVFSIADIMGHSLTPPLELPDVVAGAPNLLCRAALELPDPVFNFLDINPLAKSSKFKIYLYGAIYKLKVVLSNFTLKLILRGMLGKTLLSLNVAYIAVPVTGLWNAFVMLKVAKEARIRISGHILATYIAEQVMTEHWAKSISTQTQEGCLRAIANCIVLTQNYHPNMLILIARLNHLFNLPNLKKLDDWNKFITVLNETENHEKYLILDFLCIAAAFDGKISKLEKNYLQNAFGTHNKVYKERMLSLTQMLSEGAISEAKSLCKLDFIPG